MKSLRWSSCYRSLSWRFLSISRFCFKGPFESFHSREFTYWEGGGQEVRPERPKALHLDACMFSGGLPYALFGGAHCG
ncbi:hypothetical protein [Candidatus Neptunichlamydia sp. REUL1]|uniref:hypothetical protein n=1 Tax=Candidatus Neptunichlamydia sp. REUL1 TaxID=3064277 RepID=UPI002930C12F|nr:hypothetical protein [Candidatus Neptunochlamydia sp. REUL1]